MKLFIMIILISKSVFAFTCPQISGDWSCVNISEGKNRVNQIIISQQNIPGGVSYTLKEKDGSTEYLADGKLRSYDDGEISGSTMSKCINENSFTSKEEALLKPYGLFTILKGKFERLNSSELKITYQVNVGINGTDTKNETLSIYKCRSSN